jgi:hypothetical protein
MADFDPMNIVLALGVFAAIVVPFAWWTMWQKRRGAKSARGPSVKSRSTG